MRMWRSHDGGRTFRAGMLVDRRLAGKPADASDPVAVFDQAGQPAPAFLALRYGRSKWESRITLGNRIVARAGYGPPFPTLGRASAPAGGTTSPGQRSIRTAAVPPSRGPSARQRRPARSKRFPSREERQHGRDDDIARGLDPGGDQAEAAGDEAGSELTALMSIAAASVLVVLTRD